MSDRSPTPDQLPRFQRRSRFDDAPKGVKGRDNAGVISGSTNIKRSPAGPSDPMDKPTHGHGTNAQASLGNGGGRLGDAARSIKSGAKAPGVDWARIRRG